MGQRERGREKRAEREIEREGESKYRKQISMYVSQAMCERAGLSEGDLGEEEKGIQLNCGPTAPTCT